MANEFVIKNGFISKGDSIVNGTISGETLNLTTIPTNDNSQTQVLVRNNTTGVVEYRDASSLSGGSGTNTFVTGTTFASNQFVTTRNDGVDVLKFSGGSNVTLSNPSSNQIKIDVSLPPSMNTYVTGFTYNDNNTFTIFDNVGGVFPATINQVSGLTVNGDITVTGISNLNTVTATTIDFDLNYTGATAEGRLSWNGDDGTLDLGMGGGNVTQQIGQEIYYKIKNQSGATISNGRVIRNAGSLGASGRILGEYMIADGTYPFAKTLGIATEDIANGDEGFVTEFGVVRGIDTTGSIYGESWSDGDVLYVSPTIAGGLTIVEPTAPNQVLEMGVVLNSAINGSIFVDRHLSTKLGDISDVETTGCTNGDLIVYNSATTVWEYSKVLNGDYDINGTLSATTYYGDGSNLTGISTQIDTGNVLWVDNIFGNDGTALVDRQDRPWASIATAISNASTNDTILVRPGDYVESSFTLNPATSLVSQGGAKVTSISASTTTGNFITISGSSYMEGFTVYTPTDDSAALYMNDSTAGIVTTLNDVHFKGSSTVSPPLGKGVVMDTGLAGNGKIIYRELRYGGGNLNILAEVNKGIFALDGMHVPGGGTVNKAIQMNGGRGQLINVNVGNPSCDTALSVSGTSSNKPVVAGFGFNIFNVPIGIEITSDDYDVEVQQGRLDAGTTNVLVSSGVTGSNGKLNLTSFSMDSTKLSIPYGWVDSPHTFQFSDIGNSQNIEPILRSWSNFEVGHANKGFETNLGRGSEYQNGLHVHSSGTTGTTHLSMSAKTEGVTWSFESLTAGEQLYIGSEEKYSNGEFVRFNGFEVGYTGSTGGTYTIEYYSGGTWVDVKYQVVHHNLGYNYANTLFSRSVDSLEDIRIGIDENSGWESTTLFGHEAKWIRITMVTPPASLPQFDLLWLEPSHTEVNDNGILNFYGNALYRDTLVSAGNIFGLDGAVTDASITVGSTVTWDHIMENSQFNTSGMMGTQPGDAIMLQSILPKGTCTAYPLRVIIHYILTGSGPLTTLPEITLSVVGKETYNNFNADPAGGLAPTRRTLTNTNDLTTGGEEVNIELGELADFSSEYLSVTEEYDFDISSLYESDGVFIRIEFFDEGVPSQTITFPAIEASIVKWALGDRIRVE